MGVQSSTVIRWRKREKEREFNSFLICFISFYLLPTPGLTHNYSTVFVQNVAEKKQNGKNVTTAKERASVYKE